MATQIKTAKGMMNKLTSNNGGVYGVQIDHLKTTAEFYEEKSENGIWFTRSYHPILEEAIEEFLNRHGWGIQPYDSGTNHAYRI